MITSEAKSYKSIGVCPVNPGVTLVLYKKKEENEEEVTFTFPVISLVLAQKCNDIVMFPVIVCEGEIVIFNQENFEFSECEVEKVAINVK